MLLLCCYTYQLAHTSSRVHTPATTQGIFHLSQQYKRKLHTLHHPLLRNAHLLFSLDAFASRISDRNSCQTSRWRNFNLLRNAIQIYPRSKCLFNFLPPTIPCSNFRDIFTVFATHLYWQNLFQCEQICGLHTNNEHHHAVVTV